jgi:hypothetical protein
MTLNILGCKTSLDILHLMGEVTNAYPVLRNYTGQDLTNAWVTLSASDMARFHPNKTACVAALSAGYQVTLKLTVDTGFGQETLIQVDASTTEGFGASAALSSCRAAACQAGCQVKSAQLNQSHEEAKQRRATCFIER